jgi:predicted regulator of Ras-like GTPase activity (Roadblock/LC7/MglB family)
MRRKRRGPGFSSVRKDLSRFRTEGKLIFQRILDALLASLNGLRAAVLLDNEGETVVASHREGDDHSHRVVGAYQGIYLRDLARAFARSGLGEIRNFMIEFDGSRVFTESLQDGYYVVLLTGNDVPPSLARRRLGIAADELRGNL